MRIGGTEDSGMRSRFRFAALILCATLTFAATPAPAAEASQFDGTWEGVVKIDQAEHAFVNGATEEKTRIVIAGATVP